MSTSGNRQFVFSLSELLSPDTPLTPNFEPMPRRQTPSDGQSTQNRWSQTTSFLRFTGVSNSRGNSYKSSHAEGTPKHGTFVSQQSPPRVEPYIYRANRSIAMEATCCFCEELLLDTLEEETVIPLVCGCIAHYQCLFELLGSVSSLEGHSKERYLPSCTTCGVIAKPRDPFIIDDLIKNQLLNPREGTRKTYIQESAIGKQAPLLSSAISTTSSSSSYSLDVNSYGSRYSDKLLTPVYSQHLRTPDDSSRSIGIYASPLSAIQDKTPHKRRAHTPKPLTFATPLYDILPPGTKQSQLLPDKQSGTSAGPQEIAIGAQPIVTVVSEEDEVNIVPGQSLTCMVSVTSGIAAIRTLEVNDNFASIINNRSIVSLLRDNVESWRKLRFDELGEIRFAGVFEVSKDLVSWQRVSGYLFESMLILVQRVEGEDGNATFKVKGSVAIDKHFKGTKVIDIDMVAIELSTNQLPKLYFRFKETITRDSFLAVFNDRQFSIPLETYQTSIINELCIGPQAQNLGEEISYIYERSPVDLIIAIPISGLAPNDKNCSVLESLFKIKSRLSEYDRLGIVFYGGKESTSVSVGMAGPQWSQWPDIINKVVDLSYDKEYYLQSCNIAEALKAGSALFEAQSTGANCHFFLLTDKVTNGKIDGEHLKTAKNFYVDNVIPISSFGVGNSHDPECLFELSSLTDGAYTYVEDWYQLLLCMEGRWELSKSLLYKNVKVNLELCEGVSVTDISLDDTLTWGSTGKNQISIDLGRLHLGEAKTCLVHLSISPNYPKQRQSKLNLFNYKVSFKSCKARNGPIVIERYHKQQKGPPLSGHPSCYSPVIPIDARYSSASSNYSDDAGFDSSSIMDLSQVYGSLLAFNSRSYGGVIATPKKPNLKVVSSRLLLVATKALESFIDQISFEEPSKALHVLTSSRNIIKLIMESLVDSGELGHSGDELLGLATTLDQAIGKIVTRLQDPSNNDTDIKGVILQTLAILRKHKSWTNRSDFERAFT